MTPISYASVFTVPNKTMCIQMIPYLDDSTFNNFDLVSKDTVFEPINGAQDLKQIHSNTPKFFKACDYQHPPNFILPRLKIESLL